MIDLIKRLPLAAVTIALLLLSTATLKGADNRQSVLFILVDDLGYGDLSCYNPNSYVNTENIDRLAASGVMMKQAYAYSCSGVSRAAFLSGKFAQNIGVYSNLDAQNPGAGVHRETFVPSLKESGYRTAWFGKWDQGWDISNHPLNNGFDHTFCFLGSTHNYRVAAEGSHRFAGEYSMLGYMLEDYKPVREIGHLTDEFTNRAINYITECQKQREPYFVTVAYNAPHSPYQPPIEMVAKYLDKGLSGEQAARYALIEHLDMAIGRLLKSVSKETLIIFTSDNGGEKEFYNGGLKGAKNSIWEGGIRVPLIASQKDVIPAASSCSSLCSIVDIAATVQPSIEMDGADLMPYFKGEKSGDLHERLLFVHNIQAQPHTTPSAEYAACLAMRHGKWKILIEGVKKFASLYDIENDSCEKEDLSSKHPELLIELTDMMYEELEKSTPASAAIVKIDHRKIGDIFKADSIRRHCLELLKRE